MKLALWKRTVLGAAVAMSLVGGSLTLLAGHASAYTDKDNCTPANATCGPSRWVP